MSEPTDQQATDAAVPMDRIWNENARTMLLDRPSATRAGHLWIRSADVITQAIADLRWTPTGDGLTLPLSPALVLQAQVQRLHLQNVRALATSGGVPAHDDYEGPGAYSLYGIEAEFNRQLQRLYIVDRGTDSIVVARDLIPTVITGPWPTETLRSRRGHGFYPTEPLHRFYATEDVPVADKIIRAHYFTASADWWIVETEITESGLTGEPSIPRAFGYACLGDPDMAEWGYIDLRELETLNLHHGLIIVERDLYWTPRPVRDLNLPGIRH